jgi:aspartyl-tRNA(Asn)/glutamyl-tRNA(Gln) amidotransferase subunit B
MPELPEARRHRFTQEYALPAYDAALVTASRAAADYFEALVKTSGAEPKLCANWQLGELAAALNRDELDIHSSPLSPDILGNIVKRVADGTVSSNGAKRLFAVTYALARASGQAMTQAQATGKLDIDAIIDKEDLRQTNDAGAIEKLVDEVLAANAKQVADYRAGKEKAFNSLVGQVMKATRGKANPAQVNEILRRRLG